MRSRGARRGKGPSTYARIAEITSGTAISSRDWRQPAKTPRTRREPRRGEGDGLAHEPVRATTRG